MVLEGHKGRAFEVPFDPGKRWGLSAQSLRPGRRGFRVRARVKAKAFETAAVARSRRFWALVTDEMEADLDLETGATIRVALEPLIP